VIQTFSSNSPSTGIIPGYINISLTTLEAQAAAAASAAVATLWFGTNWCGPGGGGATVNGVDTACKAHDQCYDLYGFNWTSDYNVSLLLHPSLAVALQKCNQAFCNALIHQLTVNGAMQALGYFMAVPVGACGIDWGKGNPPLRPRSPSTNREEMTTEDMGLKTLTGTHADQAFTEVQDEQ
jgi:hypothetical protein